jgi:hypothetical protein
MTDFLKPGDSLPRTLWRDGNRSQRLIARVERTHDFLVDLYFYVEDDRVLRSIAALEMVLIYAA